MTRRTVLCVLAACAAPRLAALARWPADTGTLYFQLATSFVAEHRPIVDGELTTHIEPFYAWLLAALHIVCGGNVAAMLVCQIAVAAAGGVLLFRLAFELSGSRQVARTAVLLYAGSPYLIRQSVAFMEVTVAIALLIAASLMLRKVGRPEGAVVFGALLAAIVLTRFSFLPIAAGGLVLAFVRHLPTRAAVATAVCAGLVASWMAYSYSLVGAALPGRMGENFFESTSEWAEAVVPQTNVDVMIAALDRSAREELARRGNASPTRLERDRIMVEWAWAYVRAHPFRALGLRLRNLAYILQPRLLPFTERRGSADVVDGRLVVPVQAPRPLAFELAAGAFQALLLVGAAGGLWLRRRQLLGDDAMLLVVAGSVVAVNVIFFPTSRLLAPMTFVLMFYTAESIAALRRVAVAR